MVLTEAAPGYVNEDAIVQSGNLLGVLDGVTEDPEFDTGCEHNPAWYVQRLAFHLGDSIDGSLADLLAHAIERVAQEHPQCDLSNPSTPAATVCLIRTSERDIEYLVLGDAVLLVQQDTVTSITDDRCGLIMSNIERELWGSAKREIVNTPDGYWIAAATPQAAHHAYTGRFPLTGPDAVRRAALMTDGASRAVDMFGLFDWRGLLDIVAERGPRELIRLVRQAEVETIAPLGKRHDDATVALWHP